MMASLYHAPDASLSNSFGSASIGSSEAIMLAGLAMKKKWEARRKSEGKPYDKPNIVMGANVQVCWEKLVSLCSSSMQNWPGSHVKVPCAYNLQ